MLKKVFLEQNEVEQIAEKIIWDFYDGDTYDIAPIDIDRLAAEYFGLNIRYEKLSDTDEVLGVTAYQSTEIKLRRNGCFDTVLLPEKTVLVEASLKDNKQSNGRRRFTIGHECGHHILFHLKQDKSAVAFRRFAEGPSHTAARLLKTMEWGEVAANALSAALLMPRSLMELAFYRLCIESITVYGDDVLDYRDRRKLCNLAAYLAVSRRALLIRLKELEMIDLRPLDEFCGFTGMDIWRDTL